MWAGKVTPCEVRLERVWAQAAHRLSGSIHLSPMAPSVPQIPEDGTARGLMISMIVIVTPPACVHGHCKVSAASFMGSAVSWVSASARKKALEEAKGEA